MESRKDPAKMDNGNDCKAVVVKGKERRKETSKDTPNTSGHPNIALNNASSSTATITDTGNHKTVLNNVSRRKKKRRKKKASNKKPKARVQVNAADAKPGATIGKADLELGANVSTQAINHTADNWFNGPGNTDKATNFGQLDHSKVEAIDESILNNDGRSSQTKAEPEIHDKESVRPATIDETLVNWEHLALIIEEYFLTRSSV